MSALLLTNPVQRYAWGSLTAIPQFLGVAPDGDPWAELWMGAHPRAPSQVSMAGTTRTLSELIEQDPSAYLGSDLRDGRLPFLFKVLAAAQPLSIQCHPDAAQAQAGFDREEAAGVPRGAAHRLYPDPTAKPELVVAQSSFVGLKGFRPVDDMRAHLEAFGLTGLLPPAGLEDKEAVQAVFCRLMQAPKPDQQGWLDTAVAHARTQSSDEARWITKLSQKYPGDAGALAPLMLNLFRLEPGEALFLRARELHAYLQGASLELMANSDNVLRGGLTRKHVDVAELLRVLDFSPRRPERVPAVDDGAGWLRFETPTPQFSLRRGILRGAALHRQRRDSMEIMLCTEGTLEIVVQDRTALRATKGQSAAIPAVTGPYAIRGQGEAYVAAVGDSSPAA